MGAKLMSNLGYENLNVDRFHPFFAVVYYLLFTLFPSATLLNWRRINRVGIWRDFPIDQTDALLYRFAIQFYSSLLVLDKYINICIHDLK